MKFISSSFDPETGHSVVVMQHLGKKFSGEASVHPDEKENMSEYAGCHIAEARATIKALKYERDIAKKDAEAARYFVKTCEDYNKFNKEDDTAKCMYRQLNRRIKKVNDLADNINFLYKDIYFTIKAREKTLKTLKTLKESKADNQ
jgi:hypothetical protein